MVSMKIKMKELLIFIFTLTLLLLYASDFASSQYNKRPPRTNQPIYERQRRQTTPKQTNDQKDSTKSPEKKAKSIPLFPDEYTVLDDFSHLSEQDNKIIPKTLEHSRQKYIQALIMLEKGDTSEAKIYFENSIQILNRISNYPSIENNKDYIDLAQSIINDYESIVESIEDINDSSPFFIIREKLFNEIDSIKAVPSIIVKRLIIPSDTTQTLIGEKTVVEEPKEIVIPLIENDDVLKNIAFLTNASKKGGRRFYKKWLERTTKWFPMMRRIASEEKVPEELIYLSMIESGLRPDAVSSAKAVGLWQFISSTGKLYGLNDSSSIWIDERRDPEKSTRAALKHLKDLYETFGDWHLALAAYNCGAGRVQRTLEKYGDSTSNYWDIRDKLPRETQHYVPLYIAATKIALNPEAFDFHLDSLNYEPEYTYDTYLLNEPLSVSAIAKCLDTTSEAILNLNPELIYSITPPDVDSYLLKLPKGSIQKFVANYSALKPEDKQPWIEHTVTRGETIYKIANKYGISLKTIAKVNNLPSIRTRLKVGSTIKIPIDKNLIDETLVADNNNNQKTESLNNNNSNPKNIYHTVTKGETIYSIANKYGVKTTQIRNLNNIPYDNDNIIPGQKLLITPDEKNTIAINRQTQISKSKKIYRHKVKSGESLYSIAEKYNISVETIKDDNNLKSDKILIGQLLVIKSGENSNSISSKVNQQITHIVKSGETLSKIAQQYNVTENDLKTWNTDKINGDTIFKGSKLVIYQDQTSKGSVQANKKIDASPKYYRIKKGETLSSISRKYGITLIQLRKLNPGINPNLIKKGQKIRIQ